METITLELTQVQANWLYKVVRLDREKAKKLLNEACNREEHDESERDISIANQILDKYPRPEPSTEIFDEVPF